MSDETTATKGKGSGKKAEGGKTRERRRKGSLPDGVTLQDAAAAIAWAAATNESLTLTGPARCYALDMLVEAAGK
jgi:hypothetical protein